MAKSTRAQEAATAARESLLQLIELTDAIVVVLDAEGKVRYINQTFEQTTGYTSEELEGVPWFETLVPKDRYPQVWEEFERLTTNGTPDRFENPILTKSGEERYIVWRNTTLRQQDRIVGTASIGIDITERKRAEEVLADSKEALFAIFRSLPASILVSNAADGRICDVNEEFERLLEFKYDDVIGKTSTEIGLLADPKDRQRIVDLIRRDGKVEGLELALRTRSGRELKTRANIVPLTIGGSRYLVYAPADIHTDEQVEVLTHWIDAHSDSAFWIDTDNKFVYVSDVGCRTVGYERDELIGQPAILVNPKATPERMKDVWEMLRRDGSFAFESVHRRKDGSEFPVDLMATYVWSGGKEYFCGFAHDISERKRAQEERALLTKELQKAQKMEAIGRLAGGVAHNFNNILTALIGYCELLLLKLPEGSDCRPEAEQIKRAADHAASVTRELLVFSRREVGRPARLDLNIVVVQTQLLLRELVRSDIKIVTTLAPVVPLVMANRGQIEQVLTNLVVNATDAMPNGGVIGVETADLEIDTPLPVAGGTTLEPGRYVTLVVKDSGVGMNEETLSHLFEPFFTTKGPEIGTGLGLATVYGIVEDSGGRITVESEPKKGTSVTIYFPALPARG
jgi:PAS domain S-box-containing protein